MARTKRSAKLDTRSARLKLAAEERHQEPLSPGRYLVYRRPKSGAAGSWAAYWVNPETKKKTLDRLGVADDYEDADGSRVLTFAQAQAKAADRFKELERHALLADAPAPQDGPLTVAAALDRYFARCEALGGKSVKDARQRAELWIKPSLGVVQVAKLTRARVEAWHQRLSKASRPSRRVKGAPIQNPLDRQASVGEWTDEQRRQRKATANRMLTILKAALTCARTQGWVVCPGDAWELVKPFMGVEEPRQRYLLPEEQTRFLNAIDRPDFRNLVAGAVATGCRYEELCRMQVGDFDPTGAGSVLVRVSKAGKSRRVLLTAEGRSFFESFTAGRPKSELMFRRDEVERRAHRGKGDDHAWRKNDQQRMMHEACRSAGLPEMGFHQLRHSYASALVAAGMPLALVAKLTGHADTRMLEKHYAHLAPSDLSRALENFAPHLGLPVENIANLKTKKQA